MILETQRLYLRQLQESDAKRMSEYRSKRRSCKVSIMEEVYY